MTDPDTEKFVEALRHAYVGMGDLTKIVTTMLRLGTYPFVVKSTDDAWALSIGSMVGHDKSTQTVTMKFERVRHITKAEADLCKNAGAGSFTAPVLPVKADDFEHSTEG